MISTLRTAVAALVLSAGASFALAQTPAPMSKPATAPAAAPVAPATPAPASPSKSAPTPAETAAAPVFPSAVSDKYSKETRGKARMHTCLDQYHANKATNANGGMKWIQKGGGYYSACLKKLKS